MMVVVVVMMVMLMMVVCDTKMYVRVLCVCVHGRVWSYACVSRVCFPMHIGAHSVIVIMCYYITLI